MQQAIIGWDIGGAHIKAAVLEANGYVSKIYQKPCPLWKGIEFLHQAVNAIIAEISDKNVKHVMTMTGELVDLFDSRDQGVEAIINAMQTCIKDNEIFIYAGSEGFLSSQKIQKQHYISIASANWLASASFSAAQCQKGLFIDIGSTTTDILLLDEYKVQAIGLTDYDRMVSDELVYTGIIRTAVMAVAQTACFKGQTMGLMAEYFATMADIYRLTGELNEDHDQTDTADGGKKTVLASGKRLSRMTGYEFVEKDLLIWKQLAENIKAQQKNRIKKAIERQLLGNLITKKDYFIGAGVGRFLVKQIADELGFPYLDFSEIVDNKLTDSAMDIADCAPAVSVAILACNIKIFMR